MRTITRNGSLAMVNRNIEKGGPKAIKVQPKNSISVILLQASDNKLVFLCDETKLRSVTQLS